MKKTLYKDIKECNIKLIIIIGILFIMFSGFTSYSLFTDEVVSNNVITVKVGKKRYTLTINQTSGGLLTCTNNTTGECSSTSLQVAKDESVSCTSSTDSDYTVLLLELNNDSIGEETFTYNYEENNTITPTYVKKTPDYCFNVNANYNSITGYNCYEGNSYGYETISDVVIPSTINGVTITTIGVGAFYVDSFLSTFRINNVIIPNTVKTIEQEAFYGNNLTNVTIPNSVITIGEYAFSHNNLTSVIIGNSVTTIESDAFYVNSLTSVTIPESVTMVGNDAFYDNNLTSVKIKGKSSSSYFKSYGTNIWGWATGYSDSNIQWNYTE